MNIEVKEHVPKVYLVRLYGKCDLCSSSRIRSALLPLFAKRGLEGIIVDLSGMTHMDGSGIATLVEGRQLSRRSGVRFTLVGATPRVEAAIDLAHLKGFFDMAPCFVWEGASEEQSDRRVLRRRNKTPEKLESDFRLLYPTSSYMKGKR